MDLDINDIWEDAELTDSEADGETEWADSDTTFSEGGMSINGDFADDGRCPLYICVRFKGLLVNVLCQ